MTKEVMVTIAGLQIAAGEEQEEIELVQPGEYYFRNGTHYILFEELYEGIANPVQNVLKIKKNSLELRKKGSINTELIFHEGERKSCSYQLPFGGFLLETYTTTVQIREAEEELEVRASYELDINGEHCADCDIRVFVQSKDKFHF